MVPPTRIGADTRSPAPGRSRAGENVRGAEELAALAADGGVAVIQPDVAKWGGITGCLAAARQVLARGRRYCPHFPGAGIGRPA